MAATDKDLEQLGEELGAALFARRWRVACAESCTGGWIAKVLTDTPGSSAWFGWGFVTYADEAKTGLLHVSRTLLADHGAVSEPVARVMVEEAQWISGAELAVAVSGVAGPDGGSEDKPVGNVWFAWSGPDGTRAELQQFDGDRESVRRQTVESALQGLLSILENA